MSFGVNYKAVTLSVSAGAFSLLQKHNFIEGDEL